MFNSSREKFHLGSKWEHMQVLTYGKSNWSTRCPKSLGLNVIIILDFSVTIGEMTRIDRSCKMFPKSPGSFIMEVKISVRQ
jgi:hypothetical protein